MNMKALLFMMSAATFAVWSGIHIVNFVDPLPTRFRIVGDQPGDERISDWIEQARVVNDLPRGLIEGVIFQESKFNELARNPEKSLCKKMALKGWTAADCESRGLMGIVYGWHKNDLGLTHPKQLFDPKLNIFAGAKILKQKIRLAKGNVSKGLGLYNNDKSGKYALRVLRTAVKFARG